MVGYMVSQQTREVGIRMALGAQRADVLKLVIGRSLTPIAAGVAVGIFLGIALSVILSSMNPGLTFLGPFMPAGISFLLAVIALIAAYIPARKAMYLDPCAALRQN
jgi:putative ABC transport system permease protein